MKKSITYITLINHTVAVNLLWFILIKVKPHLRELTARQVQAVISARFFRLNNNKKQS